MDEKITKAFEMLDGGDSPQEILACFSTEDQVEIKSIFKTMDLLNNSFAEFNSVKPSRERLSQTIDLLQKRKNLTLSSRIKTYFSNIFRFHKHPFMTSSLSFVLVLSIGGLYFWEEGFFFAPKPIVNQWGSQEIIELEAKVFAVIDEPLLNFEDIELSLDKISDQSVVTDFLTDDLATLANDLEFLQQDLDNLNFNLNSL